MTDVPERHKDTARNLILNRCVSDLDNIINNHNPEVDVPINDGVWNRLDKLAMDITDAAVLAEREACAQVAEQWLYHTVAEDIADEIRSRTTQEGEK